MGKRLALAVALMIAAASSYGQRIVEDNGASNPFASAIRKASAEFPGAFPVMTSNEPEGSLVVASGDFHNSDITILVVNSRLDGLKPKVLSLLSKLNLPDTYVRVRRGRVVGSFDLEFNAYIGQIGNHSHSSIPLGAVVKEVQAWGMPKPFGVAVRGSKTSRVVFRGETIETIKLLSPKDVPIDSTVEVDSDRHWYGLLAMLFFGGMIFGVFGWASWQAVKAPPKVEATVIPPPRTLIESQARYEQLALKKSSRFIFLLPLAVFGMITFMRPAMEDGFQWLPVGFDRFIPWLIVLIFVQFAVIQVVRRIRKIPSPKDPGQDLGSFKAIRWMFIPILALMVLMQIQLFEPQWLYGIPRPVLSWGVRIIGFCPLPILLIVMLVRAKKTTMKLGPGDCDYDAAVELGKKGGVKIRRVIVLKEAKNTNAFANLFGTIGLTQGLRDKLTAKERRCIISHELGHVKGAHVPLLVLFSFVIWAGVFGFLMWVDESNVSGPLATVARIVSSPIVFIPFIFLVRSPFQRKAEFAADKFALETVGSFTEVATALAKVHLYNASPHTLKRFHESIASHPSLVKRLNSLRNTAIEMGIAVPADEIENLISTLTVEEG